MYASALHLFRTSPKFLPVKGGKRAKFRRMTTPREGAGGYDSVKKCDDDVCLCADPGGKLDDLTDYSVEINIRSKQQQFYELPTHLYEVSGPEHHKYAPVLVYYCKSMTVPAVIGHRFITRPALLSAGC